MKKFFSLTAAACLVAAAVPSTAHAGYLFGFSPTGVQTLTINGTTVIQANQTGWFDNAGNHDAGNNNYLLGDATGASGTYINNRNFFGFNLANVSGAITSAVLNVGNAPNGSDGSPVTWTVYDVNGTLNTNTQYSDLNIWNDLGSGVSYGSVNVVGSPNIVSLTFNASGLAALNGSAGSSFFVGGALTTAGAIPEPATWMMMLMGFAAVGGTMRRQRTTAQIKFA